MFVVVLSASWYVKEIQSDYVLTTQLQISEQETKLSSIALLTSKDGADPVVENIIKDCSSENRERFDMLLGKLAQLKGQELKETEQLFNACGNFYAERKAVMVARLQREYEVYVNLIDILSLVDKKAKTVSYNVADWKRLVEMETKRSELSTQLVDVQGEIIRALLQNIVVESEQMQLLLVKGQETKEALESITIQIDQLRPSVLDV